MSIIDKFLDVMRLNDDDYTSLRFLPAFSHALHIFASTCCRFSCKSIMYTLLLFYNQLVFFYFTAV